MAGRRYRWAIIGVGALLAVVPVSAAAEIPVDVSLSYTADIAVVADQQSDPKSYYLGNLDAIADIDMAGLLGWHGGTVHLYVLANHGGRPNDRAATLQGINNIEVARPGVRLFEAWAEQQIGARASLRVGLYDLNSEFYATAASDTLIAPSFGIGPELSITGQNGPSIFPSSALAMRAKLAVGKTGSVQLAVVNADARTLGDPGGVNLDFSEGVLVIGEVAAGDRLRVSLGGWGYSRAQPRFEADSAGSAVPMRHPAFGAYGLVQWRLRARMDGAATYIFARGGVSDGHSSPFAGSLQLGAFTRGLWPGRPDSTVSVGLFHGWTSAAYRRQLGAPGGRAADETGLELTYSDRLIKHVTVQPDLQFVVTPAGDARRPAVITGQMRLIVTF